MSIIVKRAWRLATLLVLGVSSLAFAQIAAGQLTGLVTDASGHAVPGAAVTVTEATTGRTRALTTTEAGLYAITLPSGRYDVRVALDGFTTGVRRDLAVATGQTVRLDITLTVGRRENVTVTAGTPGLRADTAGLGTVVEPAQVAQLPLNGRTFITLAGLAPGVALPPGSLLPRINGGRPRTNEYLFDGISVLQPEPGQVAFFPVVDAIREFKVESNSVPAEFGRFNGGVINLTTKSGTNALSGSLFEFTRNEALNERNYFQRSNPVKPRYRRNQFGGVIGGALVENHTFFFADFQGQTQEIDRTVTSTVPTALQRQGVFTEAIGGRLPVIYDPATTVGTTRQLFAGSTIPVGRIDPVAAALLQRYPLPTAGGTANNYSRTATETDPQQQWDLRVDHVWDDRNQLFARLTRFHDAFTPVTPLPDGSGTTTGTLGPQDTVSWSVASSYQHVFGPSLVNDVRLGDTRRAVGRSAASLGDTASTALGLPGIPTSARFPTTLPTFAISGYQQLGSPANTASDFQTGVTEIADTLTWVRGRHTVKAGLDFRWERLDVVQPPSPTGVFTFNALGTNQLGVTNSGAPLASFLLGQVQNFSIDLQQSAIQERAHFQEYFIEDEWKAGSRLTLNLGLRYTLNFPSTEINGQTAVFNLQTQQLEFPGANPVRELKKNNFAPRAGAVWQIEDKTIASAGYGLVWIEMAGITTPFTTPTFPFLQTVTQRSLDSINPAFVLKNGPTVAALQPTALAGLGQGVFAVNRSQPSGYVQQWNVALQRDLGWSTTLEIAYAGSRITNVGIPDSNVNQLTAAQLAQGASLLQTVTNPYFGTIPRASSLGDPTITTAQLQKPFPQYTTVSLYRNNVGVTRYQGLEIGLKRRFSDGLLVSAAYTRSKLMDTASSVFDASILTGPIANFQIADSYDLGREYDLSTGDIPHAFVGSLVWQLPFGDGRAHHPGGVIGAIVNDWTVTAVATLQSGTPVAVTQTTNFNAFAGFGVQRPNVTGDPTLADSQRSETQWFNTAAFSIAPQFTLGNASRNPVRGPAYQNLDMAVQRTLPLGGRIRLDLRLEAFNVLSSVQLGAPNGVAGSAAFGTITTAFDPRVMQLVAKIRF